MKKKAITWFIKMAWPVVKFVIINFGKEITAFVIEAIKVKVKSKNNAKMEEALKNARNAEISAELTEDQDQKLRFYELAKGYKEEAEYHKRFLSDILDALEESSKEIMETVQQKSSEVNADDVFVLDNKKGELKPVENHKLLE
ncbi:hypothetical protein [Psychrobacillus sp. NPDC096389]|uniref:hypothetical protein n=1 Tax=Psychrobacillus sp. NPDC096389 TaxID=3364490 RepID=UPI003825A6C9